MEYETIEGVNYPIKGYDPSCLIAGQEYKCIHRWRRSKYNTIYNRIQYKDTYYYLLGADGYVVVLGRHETFEVIRNSYVRVTNLKLSSDGKIYFSEEYEKEMFRRAEDMNNFREEVKKGKDYESIQKAKEVISTSQPLRPKELYVSQTKPIMPDKDLTLYTEEIRPGLILEVRKTDWRIRYKYYNETGAEDVYWNRDTIIEGRFIGEHISDLKAAYGIIQKHINEEGGTDWGGEYGAYLCEDKFRVRYKAEVGEFIFWPRFTNVRVVGFGGMKQLANEISNLPNRVEVIREQLGWKSHKGFMGKLLKAY